MATLTQRLRPVQNLGLNDRVIRGVIAVFMIALPILDLARGGMFGWHGYVILLAIYPALTAILGRDPLYSLFKVRTCGGADGKQCGTFPYEVEAALGNQPKVDKGQEFDHSMAAVREHEGTNQEAIPSKTQNRLLIIATIILSIAVLIWVYLGAK